MRALFPILCGLAPLTAHAQDLHIVTDIAPIHSLVTMVAGPDVQVDVLVSGSASPHGFQFTFDQAQVVQDADLVIWAGEALTPWLHESLATLAPDAPSLELLETGGWGVLQLREDAAFDDGHDHGEHDAHEEHEEHDHHAHQEEEHDHDKHEDDEHDHAEHAGEHNDDIHGTVDPHAWLDPRVAMVWVDHIRDALVAADPENADLYTARAEHAQTRLMALDTQLSGALDYIPQVPYLVPHDAYQYYEVRSDRPAVGAISLSDASTPSPARVAELRALVADAGVVCILTDPQSRSEWVDLVAEGSDVRTALADPMGGAFEIGDYHYFQTITAINSAYRDCLSGG